MFTWQAAVIAASVVSFPLVFKSARAALAGVDPDLENAARTMNQSETAIFFRVSLPLAFRGIPGRDPACLCAGQGEFGATLMVAGNLPGRTQTLSMAVYSAVQAGNDTLANWLVAVISVTCVLILTVTSKLVKPKSDNKKESGMKRLLTTLFLFLVLALPAQAEELIISAAASLTDAFSGHRACL